MEMKNALFISNKVSVIWIFFNARSQNC